MPSFTPYGLMATGYKAGQYIGKQILKRYPGIRGGAYRYFRKPTPKVKGAQSGRSAPGPKAEEVKCIDVADFTAALRFPAAATSLSPVLNAPVLGTADLYQRVGRKIYMKSIQVTGYVYNAATSLQSLGRILLIYDSQANAAAPTVQNVLSNMDGVYATTGCSHINLNNRSRFQILKDHKITLPACTNAAGVLTNGPSFNDTTSNRYEINWFINLHGLETVYNQINGGTILDIASGSLYMMFVTDASDATWNFKGVTRLRFRD